MKNAKKAKGDPENLNMFIMGLQRVTGLHKVIKYGFNVKLATSINCSVEKMVIST